jgi:hypothetical protein
MLINNPEETHKSPKSEIGIGRSHELYFDHYDKIERLKDYTQIRQKNEVKEVKKRPMMNKNSRRIVEKKNDRYVPIHKRINKTIKKHKYLNI